MQVRNDEICPLCQEAEETTLHVLGKCRALINQRLEILGSHYLEYEDLALLVAKASKRLWISGLRIGPIMWALSTGLITHPAKKKGEANICTKLNCLSHRSAWLDSYSTTFIIAIKTFSDVSNKEYSDIHALLSNHSNSVEKYSACYRQLGLLCSAGREISSS